MYFSKNGSIVHLTGPDATLFSNSRPSYGIEDNAPSTNSGAGGLFFLLFVVWLFVMFFKYPWETLKVGVVLALLSWAYTALFS